VAVSRWITSAQAALLLPKWEAILAASSMRWIFSISTGLLGSR